MEQTKEEQEIQVQKRARRSNISRDEVSKWKELEAAGQTRSAIAKGSGCHPAVVTRHLGKKPKEI